MVLYLIGFLSGIIGGMGIGGGTILIPALILAFNIDQHIAQSVNLISFIPMAIVALIAHFLNKNIKINILLALIVGGIIGSFLGSLIAVKLSSSLLKKLFSIFLFVMGLYEIFYKTHKK